MLPSVMPAAVQSQAAVHAVVSGSVYDSLAAKPLGGATVRIVRVDNPAIGRTTTADVLGRFRYDSVSAGGWLATFLHPVLDSLRLEPGIVRLDINEAGEVQLPLAIPGARSLVMAGCPTTQTSDVGVIVGDVRRAEDDAPLVDATVEVEWPEWVLQKGRMVTDIRRRTARSDSTGRYTLCGAPNGSTLRGVASQGADSTGAVEVVTPESGYTVLDFAVAPVERLTVRVDSTSALTATVRRGRAVVRGRVTTLDRRPLPNAIVRVLGSGTQVRSAPDGTFAISDAGAGTQTLEARAIGYAPARIPLRLSLASPSAVDVRLAIQRVQLDTVRVTAGKQLTPELRAIEQRWRVGTGTIIDGNTVRARSTLFTSDALRGVAGVTVRQIGGYGQAVMMRSSDGSECEARVIFDGSPVAASQAATIALDEYARREDIAAIEVYPRPSMVPAEFLTMATGCGVLAVWTKRATGGVTPVRPSRTDRPAARQP
ncbi:MAG TPA: carboxypeptidase regulatory-like domain-containing protein [Gemmatimonadaceae bacterium]|nr:carboxypeptidase regulatory-like domain-containing protein [Gemmatimonadaceae bacterium]